MIKKYVSILLLGMIAWTGSLAQKTANAYVRNAGVTAGNYAFDVFVKRTSATSIRIGTSNFIFGFNRVALGSPTLSNINSKYTGVNGATDDYAPMTVEVDTVGGSVFFVNVTVRFTGNGANGTGGLLVNTEPDGEQFCTVSLPVIDPNATASLSWSTTNSGITHLSADSVQTTWIGGDNSPLPVQLASFAGTVINQLGHVRLNWRTLTETNNYGFYVQKSEANLSGYQSISPLLPGQGTTLEPHDYGWTDATSTSVAWYYRLKQVDLDNTEHYSEPIRPTATTGVNEKPLPTEYGLSQNFPNPFNPLTRIEFALPKQSQVRLEVYNLLGQKVRILLDELKPAGYHTLEFNGNGLSSGLYFYKMTASGGGTRMRKMTLIK